MKKIAVFLAPGFEEIEALTPVDYLRRAGLEVATVAVNSKEFADADQIVVGSHGIPVFADMLLKDFISASKAELPDAIFFPGGMPGATNLAANEFLIELVQKMEKAGKIVSAVCASPAVVLSKTGILSGRKWTCYPKMNEALSEYCGSAEKASELTKDSVHVPDVPFVFDKNLLTGRGPGTAEQFSMKLVEILAGTETAEKIRTGSCQR